MPKLGKLAPKHNDKTLLLSDYAAALPAPPEKVYREYKIPEAAWLMFGNDSIGDCTCAAIAHMVMNATVHTGDIFIPSEDDVITAYSAVSGYDPATGLNDNGAAITDVLNYWRTTGIGGHKILGWAQIDQTNLLAVKQAVWLFSALNIGVQFPNSAQTQFANGQPWDVETPDGGIDGGHSIPTFGYGSAGTTCVTWGQTQAMSWDWFTAYCDEAYTVITDDWLDQATQSSPSGFDLATLEADLKAISA
jgi:hypothetical protein